MTYETILLEIDRGIAYLTLNRPAKLNALTRQLTTEFTAAIAALAADAAARVVVITGAGRAFCAGGDVQDVMIDSVKLDRPAKREMLWQFNQMILDLKNLEKPTIAAVNGLAVGGGCNLALACDIRLASDQARFGEVFVKRGLSGADMGGTYLLPRLVGTGRAFELLYTGDIIDAREAERIGLVNRVVPEDQLMVAVRELAEKLVKGPPVAFQLTKRVLNQGLSLDLAAELQLELDAQDYCFQTEDHKEGIASFIEKRDPEFRGR